MNEEEQVTNDDHIIEELECLFVSLDIVRLVKTTDTKSQNIKIHMKVKGSCALSEVGLQKVNWIQLFENGRLYLEFKKDDKHKNTIDEVLIDIVSINVGNDKTEKEVD